MLVRQGQLGEAEGLAALAIKVWLHTYATAGVSSTLARYVLSEFTAEKFQTRLSDASSTVLVAEIDKNLVGFAIAATGTACPVNTGAKVELATLYVQEHFVGKGVGSSLLQQAELWARQRADSSIWLTVNSKNFRAKAFYAKHGYTTLGLTFFRLGHEDHENLVLVGPDV